MKVRLLKEETIHDFIAGHANGKKLFTAWLQVLKYADWDTPADITQSLNGNLLGSNRVVFDIGGNGRNAFRMICEYKFNCPYKETFRVHLYVNWIGTHEEYNVLSTDDKLSIDKY